MPGDPFHPLQQAISSGVADDIASALHDLKREGPSATPAAIALAEPLLQHPDWQVRHAGLYLLCVRWRVPHLRAIAWEMWATDPDIEVRRAALAGWCAYDEARGNPEVGERLLQIMLDSDLDEALRVSAHICLYPVCRVPPGERPRISSKMERTNWALVWRLLAHIGVDLTPYAFPGTRAS